MVKQTTLKKLKEDLNSLPNVIRKYVFEEKSKRELSKRRSRFFGSRGIR